MDNNLSEKTSNIKLQFSKNKENEKQSEEFYNRFLKLLELEKYPNIEGREISFIKTFLSYFNPSLSIFTYIKKFKGNYKSDKNYIDYFFKVFLIQALYFFENHKYEKKKFNELVNIYKNLNIYSIVFSKLYRLGLFKIYHYEIYSRTLLLLSIIPDEISNFNDLNITINNTIKNSIFFEFSIKITKLLFLSSDNNVISNEEEKALSNFLNFLNSKILSNKNVLNIHFLQKYDEKCFNLYEFSKILNTINSKDLFEIISKIYSNSFSNIPLMYNFIEQIKYCLINFHLKSQDEFKRNSNLLNAQIKLIQMLSNQEHQKYIKDETQLSEGFYLGNNNSGFFTKISQIKNSSCTFIFSINFNQTTSCSTILSFQKESTPFFSINIKLNEKNKKYYLFFQGIKNQPKEKIIINPDSTYIFAFIFSSSKEFSIYYIGGTNRYVQSIENISIGHSIKFDEFYCCLGCEITIGKKEEYPSQFKNTFIGYIGPFIFFQKKIDKIDIINILLLKGRYSDFIFSDYNNDNIKKYLESSFFKSYNNNNSYIQSIKDLKDRKSFLKEIIRTIYPSSFNENDYYDKIDFIKIKSPYEQTSKVYSFYSESNQKKMKNNIIIQVDGDFPKLHPYDLSKTTNNKISIIQYFNLEFKPFKNKNTISEFIKFDGLKLIALHFEYYFQILTKLKNDKENGIEIKSDIIQIM